jgi:signal transduction histidine kinase/CheY-like chemotaxis protein/HPt (histidine-containing phosphotransfer) domain-containing protein
LRVIRENFVLHRVGRAASSWLRSLIDLGTAGYSETQRRRLNALNATAALIAISSASYALSYSLSDGWTYRWVIAINLGLAAMAVTVPMAHRVNEILGGLIILATEVPALFGLVALLGRDSGIQLNLVIGAAATFFILGSGGRLWLGIVAVMSCFAAHIAAWFLFPVGIVPAQSGFLAQLYVGSAVNTFGLIAALTYFSFRLAERAEAAAEAANDAKSAFLATMSHEIRTPMNGVLGMLELIGLSQLDSEQRHRLQVARDSSHSLLHVVNQILDFSKIEAGMLELNPEPASVAAILDEVHELYASAASGKNLSLTVHVDPRISPAVSVDPLRLRQVLNNFVSNALKFTSDGSVTVSAALNERRGETDIIAFSVTDTGIGISAESQKKLFQPFVQAESDTTRRFGGTGLGLAICRQLADLLGGVITIDSEMGSGTTMRLTVPLPIADATQIRSDGAGPVTAALLNARPAALSIDAAAAEGSLVLVVDDHSTNRMIMGSQLKLLGYTCETAADGRQGFAAWQSGRFGLVFTDCHMPEMDGYELTAAIRRAESDGARPRTPIVACTANAMEGEAETCLAAGMDDYLPRPIELRALLTVLNRWLPLAAPTAPGESQPGEAPAAAEALAAGANGEPPLDRGKLAELSGGDKRLECEILADFRNVSDADAAELAAAIDSANQEQITRVAHRMKGASGMIGALPLAAICHRIEVASRAGDSASVAAEAAPFRREFARLTAFLDQLAPALDPVEGQIVER